MTDNRRSATRHNVILAATLFASDESSSEEIHNLSLGGAYVTTSRRLAMGSRVTLTFRIPMHEDDIKTEGTVRWANDSSAGIQFDGLRAKEVWSLNKYFEELGD